jgi:hypothetical protein
MSVEIYLLRLRRLALEYAPEDIQRRTSVPKDQRRATMPASDPISSLAMPTCRCGRYFLEAARVNAWTVNPRTSAPEAHESIEILGRVTPSELERWAQGRQSMCTNSACPAFPVDRHGSPSLSTDLEQQPMKNTRRPASATTSRRFAGLTHDEA